MKTLTGRLFDLIKRGKAGGNIGLRIGLPKLEKIIAGIQRSIYTVLAGSTGSGKTTFALFTYIYKPLTEMLGNPGFKIVYYSLEMTAEVLMAKLASMHIWDKYGVELPYDVILSRNAAISDENYAILEDAYEWLSKVEEHLIIYDKAITCDGLYAHLMSFAEENGEFVDISEHQTLYVSSIPNQYVMVILDHIGLIRKKTGQSKKEAIDTASNYLIHFRNKCGYSPVVLMQVNRQSSSMDRRNAEMQELQLDDLKDSGTPSEDADLVIALFNPFREKVSNYREYKIKLIKEYFRSALVLKNRYGEADKMVPLNFFGSIGYFKELPKPDEITLDDYDKFVNLSYAFEVSDVDIKQEEQEVEEVTEKFMFTL